MRTHSHGQPCLILTTPPHLEQVLRHLNRGYGPEVLDRTLKSDAMKRRAAAIREELAAALAAARADVDPDIAEERLTAAKRYAVLEAKLAGTAEYFGGARGILTPKQQKEAKAEMTALKDRHGANIPQISAAVSAGA
eukprot:scaffold179589_cov30-Tisochrysis_lutea.AAC.6